MRKAVEPFKKILSDDQRLEIMQIALLRCLQGHTGSTQKFTTSLYRFTKWECQNATRNMKRQQKRQPVSLFLVPDIAVESNSNAEEISNMHECIDMLDPSDQALIRGYYLDQMTLEEIGNNAGYTRQAARWNVQQALGRLQRLCLRD